MSTSTRHVSQRQQVKTAAATAVNNDKGIQILGVRIEQNLEALNENDKRIKVNADAIEKVNERVGYVNGRMQDQTTLAIAAEKRVNEALDALAVEADRVEKELDDRIKALSLIQSALQRDIDGLVKDRKRDNRRLMEGFALVVLALISLALIIAEAAR